MNRSYRSIWSPARNAFIAAPESARAKGKGSAVLVTVLAIGLSAMANAWGAGGMGGTSVPPTVGGAGGDVSNGADGSTYDSGSYLFGAGGGGGGVILGGGATDGQGASGGNGGNGGAGGNGGEPAARYLGTPPTIIFVSSPLTGGRGGAGAAPTNNVGGFVDGGGGGGGGGGYGMSIRNQPAGGLINVTSGGPVQGGDGGNGGSAVDLGGGGGGGQGGGGLLVRQLAPASISVGASSSIKGGAGGAGGNGVTGGSGGDGGLGINITSVPDGVVTRIVNNGTISGGAGGARGANGNATAGRGGVAIVGANLSIFNAGTISGGMSGDGLTRADAIQFAGTSNRLELQGTSNIIGNVQGSAVGGAVNTLALAGFGVATFDASRIGTQYRGFNSFEKVNSGTWTLTGTSIALTPWRIADGVLAITSDANLGAPSGSLTLAGGTLRVGPTAAVLSRPIVVEASGGTLDINGSALVGFFGPISGAGRLTFASNSVNIAGNGGTATLGQANTYSGGTVIRDAVTVTTGTTGSLGTGSVELQTANSVLLMIGASSAGSNSYSVGRAGSSDANNRLTFVQNSTAGASAIAVNGTDWRTTTNALSFQDNATAGAASIANAGGSVSFLGNASAGSATITNGGNGLVQFLIGTPTAGTATIVNQATGTLRFTGTSTGESATVVNQTGAVLDVSGMTAPLTLGTLSGGGTVVLGGAQLRVGATNASASISGAINDFGSQFVGAGTGGSLVKLGSGTLTLTGTNTYTGGTTVEAGRLVSGGVGAFVQGREWTINGGTLDLGNWNLSASRLSGAGGAIALNAQRLTVNQSGDSSFAGAITGSGGLVKTGTGTLALMGASSYTGGTALKQGRIDIGNSAALGTGELAMDDGTALGIVATGVTFANAIRMTGSNDPIIDTGSFDATVSGAISGGGFLTKQGVGTLTLSGANTYTGATDVAQGTLRAGATNTISAASATTVAAGATLDLAGFNQTLASVNNSGTISLAGAAPGTTLTVTGPWVGNGGTLAMSTAVGGDSSATDRVVFSGANAMASGTTRVAVTNIGGLGALTTGNGISLISAENGARINDGAFTLAAPVSAGAFDYRLNIANGGIFLSNNIAVAPTAPTTPTAPATPALPTSRADVPLYAALAGQFRESNLAMLGNMRQRMGDDGATGASTAMPEQGYRQAWARVISIDRDIAQSGTVSPSSSGRLTGFQAGTDLWADSSWRAGVYVGQLEGDMRVSGFARGILNYGAGFNDLRSQYLGAYATWKNDSGLYVDGALQAGRHRYTASPTLAASSGGKGDSLLASVEMGQAFRVAPNWVVEPQVQLIHQRVDLNDTSITGALVQQGSASGWTARAGVRVKGEFQTGAGTVQPYARVNFYKRGNGMDVTRFVGPAGFSDIVTRTGGTSSELAVGATWQLSASTGLYGEMGKLWASGGDARTKSGVNGSLGVKVRW